MPVSVIAPGAKQGGNCQPSEEAAQSCRLSVWHSFCYLVKMTQSIMWLPRMVFDRGRPLYIEIGAAFPYALGPLCPSSGDYLKVSHLSDRVSK